MVSGNSPDIMRIRDPVPPFAMNLLFVATKAPWPPIDGGRLLLARTLEALAALGHDDQQRLGQRVIGFNGVHCGQK